jgi:pimeloyl-ACP methyl ester carboxylesterase
LTALFLHGGPGAGCSPDHARFFDPEVYRVVLLDQRGSGRSEPRGEAFVNNTLLHLVRDCEALRIGLGIGRWDVVLGGSWGSTLAVAYAQEHPRSVRSLLLRGVCLLRQSEVDWLTSRRGGAASAVDPEGWAEFSSAVGVNASNDCTGRDALHAYYDRLLGSNQPPEVRLLAARSWMRWEMRVSAVAREHTDQKRNETGHSSSSAEVLVWNQRYGWGYCNHSGTQIVSKTSAYRAMEEIQQMRRGIHPKDAQPRDQQLVEPRPLRPVRDEVTLADLNASAWSRRQNQSADEVAGYIPAQTMLTCFYSVNRHYAMNGVDLLSPERMARIRNTRCIAVQGAMDAICPPDTALDLHIAWPEMELRIPRFSGHSMYDRGITHELVRATERLASELLEARLERRY